METRRSLRGSIGKYTKVFRFHVIKLIITIQDGANKRLINKCKGFGVKGDYLGKLAGESVFSQSRIDNAGAS